LQYYFLIWAASARGALRYATGSLGAHTFSRFAAFGTARFAVSPPHRCRFTIRFQNPKQ
jgi:hypothetical protein